MKNGDTITYDDGTVITMINGKWYDQNGTQWHRTAEDDPGYAGIAPIETNKLDPSFIDNNSPKHDHAFDDDADGWLPPVDPADTAAVFIGNELQTEVRDIYGAITSIPYAFLGGVIGYFREWYLRWKRQNDN